MTIFLYAEDGPYTGRQIDMPAEDIHFKQAAGLVDPEDGTVTTFDRVRAHLPGRCTVVFVERGVPRGFQLQQRIKDALARKCPAPKPVAKRGYPFDEVPEPPPKRFA